MEVRLARETREETKTLGRDFDVIFGRKGEKKMPFHRVIAF
jgi:hypothetical protein